MAQHKLVNDTLTVEHDGILAKCVCGWESRSHFSSFGASSRFQDHQEAEIITTATHELIGGAFLVQKREAGISAECTCGWTSKGHADPKEASRAFVSHVSVAEVTSKKEAMVEKIKCQKCGATSGGDWSQCKGVCPMPSSPHFKMVEEIMSEVTSGIDDKCACGAYHKSHCAAWPRCVTI